jgi:SAM-dependent methyltransferase
MSEPGAGAAAPFVDQTLARFEQLRQAWQSNEALRTLYGRWYRRVREALPSPSLGRWVEIGSGPGFGREFIPEMELTDLVQAPWHARQVDAQALPFERSSLGALVLFDVLHHVPVPARFLAEAERVLRPGGRVVLCEPYMSPLSYPVYRYLHEEGADLRADALAEAPSPGDAARDPFLANQAIPTLLFERQAPELARRFPGLRLRSLERLAGPAYPSSGGFSRAPLLPMPLWRALLAVEDHLPQALFRVLGFRLLAVVERV